MIKLLTKLNLGYIVIFKNKFDRTNPLIDDAIWVSIANRKNLLWKMFIPERYYK